MAKQKYQAEMDQQVREVKEYYAEVLWAGKALEKKRQEESDDEEVEGEEGSEEEEEEGDLPGAAEYRESLVSYGKSSIAADHPDDIPKNPYHQVYTRKDKNPIYVIPKEVFYSDEDDFEKETLVWYSGDDVMVDFYDNVVTDYYEVVGSDFGDSFVKDGQTRNTWVRNERHQIDYEIELNENDYTEIVLGFTPEREGIRKFRDDD